MKCIVSFFFKEMKGYAIPSVMFNAVHKQETRKQKILFCEEPKNQFEKWFKNCWVIPLFNLYKIHIV